MSDDVTLANTQGLAYRRLIVFLTAALWLVAVGVAVAPWEPLRGVCGVLLFFAFPGVLASYALVPAGPDISGGLRFVLSVGLSVVIAVAVGLALALCFDEISRGAAAASLGGIGTLAAIGAYVRVDEGDALSLPAISVPVFAGLVSVVGLVACAAIAVAALNVNDLPGHFTVLTATPSTPGVQVEVRNHEGRAMSYRYLVEDAKGRQLGAGTISTDTDEARTLELSVPRSTHVLTVALYHGSAQPYRQVTLRGLNQSAG